jgi:hypothetical protein
MKGIDIEQRVREAFVQDVSGHRLIVRHDQGLYRHLVFQQRQHSWNNWFELITAPGSLTVTGDRGSHTFRRLTDMFQFFRSNPDRPHRINISYWAEKTADHGESVKVYSEELLHQLVDEHLQEAIRHRDAIQAELDEENARQLEGWREDLRAEGVSEGDPDWPAPAPERAEDWPELIKARKLVHDAQELIQDADDDGMLGWADGARQLLGELENIGLVSGTWEWGLTDWDYHFVWCLHAIAWGIQQYDNAVRSGLHVIRSGPVPWDTPLPTTPPAAEDPAEKTAAAAPIKAAITIRSMRTVQTTEAL